MAQQQRTRFAEFDIGRAISILGLPFVHVLEEGDLVGILPPGFLESHVFLLALSAFGAPLFMACMGANMVFTRHSTPGELARRGVELLIMGMLLNVGRLFLPDTLFGSIAAGEFTLSTEWIYDLAGCDIYDFAGLCFLSFALFRKLRLSPKQILAIAAAALVVGAYVLPYFFANPEETIQNRLMGRLFWMNEYSCFPLLTWLIFPALGYAYGSWFKSKDGDEARWQGMKKMMPVAAAIFAITAVAVIASGQDLLLVYASPANSYITDIPNVALVGSTLLFAATLTHKIAIKIQGSRALAWFVRTSKGIIPYYTCQWICVCWLEYLIGDLGLQQYAMLNEWKYWLTSFAIVIVSLQFAKLWMAMKAKRKECGQESTAATA